MIETSTSKDLINFSYKDGVIQAELNNFGRRNALSPQLLEELASGASDYLKEGAKIIVISGSNSTFSSGVDVSWVTGTNTDPQYVADRYLTTLEFSSAMNRFASLPLVKVAQIDGYCFGAGVILASYCDVRIASQN